MIHTVLYPTNKEGKYVIQVEGIRLARDTHGGSLTNVWINDTNGVEKGIVIGYDNVDEILNYKGNPFLNAVIGVS